MQSARTRLVRNNSGVDLWERENAKPKMRVVIKRILHRHGYTPDLASEAVKLVSRRAEALVVG
ncbi:type I restriction enzyme endonuclease domain-containing protein [Robbsia betulipollinis]|uniref:type I restriction enzyme endonuclease domain-containing protein n=1 Tax=Robbsia betulipollinis TaxID=2981849 RepID=UPI003D7AEA3F